MSNYSVLQQNVVATFETDEGAAAFLWACSLPDADCYQYRAEAFAREVDRLAQTVWWMVVAAFENAERRGIAADDDARESLFRFIMDRHTFLRFPGRQTGWTQSLSTYPEEAAT